MWFCHPSLLSDRLSCEMSEIHEDNRTVWDGWANWWASERDAKGIWKRCHREPELVFLPGEMELLHDVDSKDVCVLASGDNETVFALAGMGAKVTSVDISQNQLDIAARRADELGLDVTFLRSDATDISSLRAESFDLVYTGIGVTVWISDIRKYYGEAVRILKSGGVFIVKDGHPFPAVLSNEAPLEKHTNYFERGPYEFVSNEGHTGHEHYWTVGDHVRAVLDAGCELVTLDEVGQIYAGQMMGSQYDHTQVDDDSNKSDRLTLPAYLLIAARKR